MQLFPFILIIYLLPPYVVDIPQIPLLEVHPPHRCLSSWLTTHNCPCQGLTEMRGGWVKRRAHKIGSFAVRRPNSVAQLCTVPCESWLVSLHLPCSCLALPFFPGLSAFITSPINPSKNSHLRLCFCEIWPMAPLVSFMRDYFVHSPGTYSCLRFCLWPSPHLRIMREYLCHTLRTVPGTQ